MNILDKLSEKEIDILEDSDIDNMNELDKSKINIYIEYCQLMIEDNKDENIDNFFLESNLFYLERSKLL